MGCRPADVRAGGRRARWLRRSRRAQIGTGKGYDLLSGATIDLGKRAQLRMDEVAGRDLEAELRSGLRWLAGAVVRGGNATPEQLAHVRKWL